VREAEGGLQAAQLVMSVDRVLSCYEYESRCKPLRSTEDRQRQGFCVRLWGGQSFAAFNRMDAARCKCTGCSGSCNFLLLNQTFSECVLILILNTTHSTISTVRNFQTARQHALDADTTPCRGWLRILASDTGMQQEACSEAPSSITDALLQYNHAFNANLTISTTRAAPKINYQRRHKHAGRKLPTSSTDSLVTKVLHAATSSAHHHSQARMCPCERPPARRQPHKPS
jgi:hypothetical protein